VIRKENSGLTAVFLSALNRLPPGVAISLAFGPTGWFPPTEPSQTRVELVAVLHWTREPAAAGPRGAPTSRAVRPEARAAETGSLRPPRPPTLGSGRSSRTPRIPLGRVHLQCAGGRVVACELSVRPGCRTARRERGGARGRGARSPKSLPTDADVMSGGVRAGRRFPIVHPGRGEARLATYDRSRRSPRARRCQSPSPTAARRRHRADRQNPAWAACRTRFARVLRQRMTDASSRTASVEELA
jgi:hypothetical protein